MTKLKPGDKAPDFTLPADNNGPVTLSGLLGRNVILFFYPKDNTPGCTAESCDFRDHMTHFEDKGVSVIGISKDSLKSHEKFRDKHGLNFPLASDEEGKVCDAYGVWKEKNMYGRTFMGIERTTFLIDSEGTIRNIWRKVKVKDHVSEVLKAASEIAEAA